MIANILIKNAAKHFLYEFYESSYEKLSRHCKQWAGILLHCVIFGGGIYGTSHRRLWLLDTSASTVGQILLFCNALSFLMMSFLLRLAAQKHGAWARVQCQAAVLTSNRYLSPSPQSLLLPLPIPTTSSG